MAHSWKTSFIAVSIAQLFGMIGFSLALPFSPYFIQDLGVTDPNAVKWWAAACQSVVGFSLAVMAPIWGSLADRFGRKLMMTRAQFAGVAILFGMSLSPSVQVFFVLRMLQGMFTGTIGAATTYVATIAPRRTQGIALGSLSAAHFIGFMLGPMVGGFLADEIGYRQTFAISSVLIFIGGILVLFFVKEDFVKPTKEQLQSGDHSLAKGFRASWPFLLLMFAMVVSRTFDAPVFPLYVQEIHGRLDGASRWTGIIAGAAALGATLSALIFGRLADRIPPARIMILSAIAGAVLVGLIGLLPYFAALIPIRFALALCVGGMDPVLYAWVAKKTPESQRGVIFGWSATARSLGWGTAPFISGGIAVVAGTRSVYAVAPFMFLLFLPLVALTSKWTRGKEGD